MRSDYDLAARETAKLSSSIWKRVISPSEAVKIIAKADSMIFPVSLILVASSPTMTARSALAKMSWTSKRICSIRRRVSRMKSEAARRPVLSPIQGNAPTSPAISNWTSTPCAAASQKARRDQTHRRPRRGEECAAACPCSYVGEKLLRDAAVLFLAHVFLLIQLWRAPISSLRRGVIIEDS